MLQGNNNRYNRAYSAQSEPQYAEPIQWGATTCWPRGFAVFCCAGVCLLLQAAAHWTDIISDFHFQGATYPGEGDSVYRADMTYSADIGIWIGQRVTVVAPIGWTGDWGQFDDTTSFPFMRNYETSDGVKTECNKWVKGGRALYCVNTICTVVVVILALMNMQGKFGFPLVGFAALFNLLLCVITTGVSFGIFYTSDCGPFNVPRSHAKLGISPVLLALSSLCLFIAVMCAAVLRAREPADIGQFLKPSQVKKP